MARIHSYEFHKAIKGLFAGVEELQLQLAATRQQCEEISAVMIAIRQNPVTAKNYPLPIAQPRGKAAND